MSGYIASLKLAHALRCAILMEYDQLKVNAVSADSNNVKCETETHILDAQQHMSQVLRTTSIEQIEQFVGGATSSAVDIDYYTPGQVLANELVLLTISGPELQLLVKIHFNYQQIRSRFRSRVSHASAPLSRQDVDFIKELGNQFCGAICRKLASQDIMAGLSIPLSTRGYYEIYADYTHKTSPFIKFGEGWGLEGDFGTLYFSCYSELSNPQVIPKILAINPTEDAPAQDIDFF